MSKRTFKLLSAGFKLATVGAVKSLTMKFHNVLFVIPAKSFPLKSSINPGVM
ncbi:hypothetical protein D3C71_374050 [compost metagenome]